MHEKKWKDCPVCGAKNTMQKKDNLTETFELPGYDSVKVSGLDGQFCETCGEGFWSKQAERKISCYLEAIKARQDALLHLKEATRNLNSTIKKVHKKKRED